MAQIKKHNWNLGNEKACGLRKRALATAIGMALGGVTGTLMAALPDGTLLNFDAGTPVVTGCLAGGFTNGTCAYGTAVESTDMGGSYFSMDTNGDGTVQPSEKTAIAMFAPLNIGTVQESSGQHTSAPDGSESPAIDKPWNFNGNAGMHNLSKRISVLSDGGKTQLLDLTGWGVNWGDNGPGSAGGAPTIPMGGQTSIICAVDCSNNDTYTLDMSVHVPVAFTSVPYTIHLQGTVSLPGAPPMLNDDSGKTIIGNPLPIDVLVNDTSADGFKLTSQAVSPGPTNGAAVINADGTITYTPNTGPDFTGTDTFKYTINSGIGISPAGPALVTVQVAANVKPVAVADTLDISTAVLSTTPQVVSVLDNDTDTNNALGLPGGINPATVTVIAPPAIGSCTADTDPASPDFGTITYSQTAPVVKADVTCTYEVTDIDTVNTPLTSNVATLTIKVTESKSDWPSGLDPDIIPVLFFEPGVKGDPTDSSVPAKSGSYFTMQVDPKTLIYTMEEPGPDGGFIIGYEQPAGNSHTGAPTGDEETSADLGWNFFGNTGFTFTSNGGLVGNPDGTIQFGGDPAVNGGQGRYIITWTGIPAIDLGGDPTGKFTEDLGFGFITCTPAPCADQSKFDLKYAAHVPPGDPSGFGGVPYTLYLTGTVGFLDRKLIVSNGTVASESRLSRSQVVATDPDSEVEIQCAGDCFDYRITGVTDSRISIVFPLAGGVPSNPVWRILDSGTWRSFDTSAADSIQSAPHVAGNTTCPAVGDASWGDVTTGHYCIKLAIADNGLNDLDSTTGIISDPGGMGSGGTAGGGTPFVDTRTSNTSGCSIAGTRINPLRRSEWWLLAGFVAWLGWNRRRRQKN